MLYFISFRMILDYFYPNKWHQSDVEHRFKAGSALAALFDGTEDFNLKKLTV